MTMLAWDSDYSTRGRLWGGSVRDLPDLPAGTRVLELGCGDGKTLSAMPRSWRIAALDISLPALRLCTRSQSDLILASAQRLPFKKESFDAVFSYHVAGHLLLTGRRAFAAEVERVLHPGGRLFFRDFGREDMRMGLGQEVEEATFLRGTGIFTHYFTQSETSELFCRLVPLSIENHCWKMRVKGCDRTRSQVEAIFLKS